jgi:hypothetical protein
MTTANQIKKGEFIKRKADANKVYIARGYCRFNKAYQFDDADDISRCIYIKGAKIVFVDFEY